MKQHRAFIQRQERKADNLKGLVLKRNSLKILRKYLRRNQELETLLRKFKLLIIYRRKYHSYNSLKKYVKHMKHLQTDIILKKRI
jgi:hypothetical protein